MLESYKGDASPPRWRTGGWRRRRASPGTPLLGDSGVSQASSCQERQLSSVGRAGGVSGLITSLSVQLLEPVTLLTSQLSRMVGRKLTQDMPTVCTGTPVRRGTE